LFAINFPQQLSSHRLDRMLAQGWFRYGQCFQKPQVICVNDTVCDVLNIRLDIEKHQFSKSQRKLIRRNDRKFQFKIQKATVTKEKEKLYQLNKFRFKGFLTRNLEEFLNFEYQDSIFNTYEIGVYHNKQLIALSYFDLGKKSIAGILGLLNWTYAKESLGMYTMMKELEFAKQAGFKFYYPGFIMVQVNDFDYKLKLGDFSYLATTRRWRKLSKKNTVTHMANLINTKNEAIEAMLKKEKIAYNTYAYPLYSLDYMQLYFIEREDTHFLNTCKFIKLKKQTETPKNQIEIMYFDPIQKQFKHAIAETIAASKMQINEMSKEMHRLKNIFTDVLKIVKVKNTAGLAEGLLL